MLHDQLAHRLTGKQQFTHQRNYSYQSILGLSDDYVL